MQHEPQGGLLGQRRHESFYSTLKTELIYHEIFRTRDEARRAVFEYIEMFYNRIRRHSTLGYLSPVDFELAA